MHYPRGVNAFNPFVWNGIGLGTDFGFSADWDHRWYINASMLDLAFVYWFKNTQRYTGEGNIQYYSNTNVLNEFPNDSLADAVADFSVASGSNAWMPYPTRIRLSTAYRIPGRTHKGLRYHKHSFALT